MMNMFEMTDLGELNYFFGICDCAGIFMCQKKYVVDTLEKFNMTTCNCVSTPMNLNEKLVPEDGTGLADGSMFRSLTG